MVAGWLEVVVVADNRKQRARGSDKTRPRARTAIPMHTPQYPLRAGNTHGQDGGPGPAWEWSGSRTSSSGGPWASRTCPIQHPSGSVHCAQVAVDRGNAAVCTAR